jgi:hypothetical protein
MTERHHLSRSGPDLFVLHAEKQLPEPAMKPRGFWYEVDGDWRRWLDSEFYPEEWGYTDLFRLELGKDRILYIRSVAELDDFDETYHAMKHYPESYGQPFDMCMGIRWREVAQAYDGIEIAPYQWTRRLNGHIWYYGWDCASGCIWRPKGARLTYERKLSREEVQA